MKGHDARALDDAATQQRGGRTMHPEFSLVLLTVLAGAGQGILILMVALDSLFYNAGIVTTTYLYAAGAVSLALQTAGVVASTSHLGNPQRGWRSMLMVKNSWLSREVITLSLSVGCALLYLLAFHFRLPGNIRLLIGAAGILSSIGFYISSSMVYASVTFIREWANAYTPLSFLVFGIASGAGATLPLLYYSNSFVSIIRIMIYCAIALAVLSLIIRILAYRFNTRAYVSVNIRNAVSINDPDIKLMDMGSSYDHFNTKEYYYPVSEKSMKRSKALALTLAFIVPLILWTVVLSGLSESLSGILSGAASVSLIIGLLIDRRLFFIQGNNIQNLYYSNFRSTGAPNPLVSKARRGTPQPAG
jgi:DMSO reductase anchor subunit